MGPRKPSDDDDVIKFSPICEQGYPQEELRRIEEFRQKLLKTFMIPVPLHVIFPDQFSPPDPIIHSMTSTEALDWLVKLAHEGVSFGVDHDVDYGIDKRRGWTVTIDGATLCAFAPTFERAVELARGLWLEMQHGQG